MFRSLVLGVLAACVFTVAVQAASNPDAVAVIIGNRNYEGRVPNVDYAHRDADAVRQYVLDVLGYDPDNVIDLRDATKAQLETTFGNFQSHKGKLWRYIDPAGGSDITVFYSGHGVPGQSDGRGYLLPSNANPDTAELNGYPIDLLYENLGKLEARSVTVMLDACFSGDSRQGMLIRSASPVFVKSEMPQTAGGMTVLTAASGSQLASWDDEAEHGLFTRHLMDAVYGAADGNGDGQVTAGEVKTYLDRKMTRAARREFGREQDATLTGSPEVVLAASTGGSFPERQALSPAPGRSLAPKIALEAKDTTMFVGASRVNVRNGPGTEFEKVGTLPPGTEVLVTGKVKQKDWYQIALAGGASGYVFGKLLTEQAPGGATPAVGSFSQTRQPGDAFRDCPFCPEMVALPAGSFSMGSPVSESGRQADEGPVHRVSIPRPFAIGKYEVTMGEYSAFVNQTGYRPDGPCHTWDDGEWKSDAGATWRSPGYTAGSTQPVVCVSWNDAKAYTRWLSSQTGKSYRLPSEAEWEYASRAGTMTVRHWGDDVNQGCRYANMSDLTAKDTYAHWTTADCRDGYLNTAPVGSYSPNAFGLHDTMGNVFEWTEDCKHETYDGAPADGSAWTVGGNCDARVLRGGSWYVTPPTTRSANRVTYSKKHRYDVGFRVAQDLQ